MSDGLPDYLTFPTIKAPWPTQSIRDIMNAGNDGRVVTQRGRAVKSLHRHRLTVGQKNDIMCRKTFEFLTAWGNTGVLSHPNLRIGVTAPPKLSNAGKGH